MVGEVLVRKTVSFNQGVTITYTVTGDASLTIRPLITDRSVDQVVRDPKPDFEAAPGGPLERDGLKGDLPFTQDPVTYWNLWYEREQERGYDLLRTCSPGILHRHGQGRIGLAAGFPVQPGPGKTVALPLRHPPANGSTMRQRHSAP